MKFVTFFPVLLLLFLSLSGVAFAKDGGHEDGGHDGHSEAQVSVSSSSGHEEGVTEAAEVGEAAEVDEAEAEAVAGDTFEFEGEVTSIVDNTFVVAGETVVIDPTMVEEFEQDGILAVGAMVKVEGVIIGGTNFAQEIKVL